MKEDRAVKRFNKELLGEGKVILSTEPIDMCVSSGPDDESGGG